MPEIVHTVKRGETLFLIARQYNVTIQAIAARNNITNPDLIFEGQQLIIPVSTTPPVPGTTQLYTVRPGDTTWIIAQRFRTTSCTTPV